MAFPAGLTLVTVAVRADLLPSGGAAGTVRITYGGPLTGATDNSIVPYVDVTASLDASGEAELELPATNDPGWVPQDFAYTVVANFGTVIHRGTLQLDYQTTSVQLSDLIQWDGAATTGTTYATLAQLTALQAEVDAAEADIAAAEADIDTLTSGLVTASSNALAALYGSLKPTDQNLVGWTFNPDQIQGGFQLASAGLAYVLRVRALTSVVTNIEIEIETAGSSLSNCFALVTNDAGAQIGSGAVTANQATAWQSTGRKKMPLINGGSGVTVGAFYRIVLWANGSDLPHLSRAAAGVDPNTLNTGLTAPTLRWSTANTGMTVDPEGSFNLTAQTAIGTAIWGAFS